MLRRWLSSVTLLRALLDGWQARRACCSFLLGLWWLLRLEPICTVSNNADEGRRLLLGAFLNGEALKHEVVTVRLPQIYLVALPKRICLLADLFGVATARNYHCTLQDEFLSDPCPIIGYACHSLTDSLLFSRLDGCK